MCSVLETVTLKYQTADFVAVVKIIKNYKNSPSSNEYYKADIEIVNQYKGKKIKSLSILGNNGGDSYNSCGTFIPEGATRLIFGNFDSKGNISTYLCNSYIEPLEDNYKKSKTSEKLELLKLNVKDFNIRVFNETAFYPYDFKYIYKPEMSNYYSLIKIVINKDSATKKIEFITETNDELTKAYNDYFFNVINWKSRLEKVAPKLQDSVLTIFFEIKPFTTLKPKN